MSDVENTLVRHIVGTRDAPEIREPESSTRPGPAVLIKGSIDEMNAGSRQVGVIRRPFVVNIIVRVLRTYRRSWFDGVADAPSWMHVEGPPYGRLF
ncbi:hypothetical protein [Paenarthrobacter nitroguajacolicus]